MSHESRSSSSGASSAAKTGLGTGAVLAMIISWSLHQSILWALFHGMLGWIYVIYFAITR
jgi:hypothetical protein